MTSQRARDIDVTIGKHFSQRLDRVMKFTKIELETGGFEMSSQCSKDSNVHSARLIIRCHESAEFCVDMCKRDVTEI